MNIKIKCTQQEFGRIVRDCARMQGNVYCSGCIFTDVCSTRDGNCGIEHIAAFEIIEDGDSDG